MQRVANAAASVDRIVASGETVYGVNTGFGLLANTRIPDDRLAELQTNLILSHSAGLGEPLPRNVTRLMIILKLLGLGRGYSGVRPVVIDALQALHKAGNTLLIKGRPVREVPREVLHCFAYSIVDLAEDRRINETPASATVHVARSIPHVQAGVRTLVEMEGSFNRGAAAVLGWPIDDAIVESQSRGKATGADLQVIVELIQRVDAQEPIEKLEGTLKRDPSLAFKLMRYINSPAFGLRVEISSFRHAIMMLGYERLKRWLALLLSTAGKDANMKPVMFAAVRRGLLMEELVRSSGDEEMRNEMFICGVFSLLDRMFKQPFSELLKTIPVPERVHQALVDNAGPYQPYFNVVQAVENESLFDFRASADALMLSVGEINHAVLTALTAAAKIE